MKTYKGQVWANGDTMVYPWNVGQKPHQDEDHNQRQSFPLACLPISTAWADPHLARVLCIAEEAERFDIGGILQAIPR